MKERIILAPGLNGTELTQSLVLHGVNCIGIRICGAAELARMALMHSGIAIAENIVSIGEETAFTAGAVTGETYFSNPSYQDIQEITSALRRMRSLVTADDEEEALQQTLSKGIFREKNDALLNVYHRYMELLSAEHAIDSTALIRRALKESKVINAEFLTLSEYPLNPLEEALILKVSGGHVSRSSLPDLFGVEEGSAHADHFRNCYGAPNEVETILEDLYQGKKLDESTVAVTDSAEYSQLFFDYALLHDIPISFGCGIPIMNSNPARLLSLYYNWTTKGFFGAEALMEMLFSEAFNRKKLIDQFPTAEEGFELGFFYEVLGGLRFTNDLADNEKKAADFKRALTEFRGSAVCEAAGSAFKEVESVHGKAGSDVTEYEKNHGNTPSAGNESGIVGGNYDSGLKEDETVHKKMRCIPYLEICARELALPAEEFISKYVNIRKGGTTNSQQLVMMLDMAAELTIFDELKVIRSSGISQSVDDIIPNLLKRNVCTQRSEAGKLYVTGIDGALAGIRKNLYIAGLSASAYPGSPRENYLLLDADLELFGSGAKPYTADGKVMRRRESLLTLVRLASALGSTVSVSYSGLNVSELKKDNPSSLVFELLREQYGSSAEAGELEKHVKKVEYFEPAISSSRLVGDGYVRGLQVCRKDAEGQQTCREDAEGQQTCREDAEGQQTRREDAEGKQTRREDAEGQQTCREDAEGQQTCREDAEGQQTYSEDADAQQTDDLAVSSAARKLDKAWSPTALDIFFSCKRRFMLRYLLGIPEPDDYDPFQILTALDNGIMAHTLMERLGKTSKDSMSRDDFVKLSEETFNRFLMEHPPLILENVPAVRDQFLEMMETAYDMDPGREIVLEEEDISCTHESGVRLHGYPDRVEKLDDGTYVIVDFKSGQRIVHVQDDIVTCLQIVIYAYLMEKEHGIKVSGGEYRYIRSGQTVSCRYDDEIKAQLAERLEEFKECMQNGTFPVAEPSEDGVDPCRFCRYQNICGKGEESVNSEEGGAD